MSTMLDRPEILSGEDRRKAVYRKAAALIREHGHVHWRYYGANGEICMAEALARASGSGSFNLDHPDYNPTVVSNLLWNDGLLADLGFTNLEDVCEFNNSHTEAEVVAKLETAGAV